MKSKKLLFLSVALTFALLAMFIHTKSDETTNELRSKHADYLSKHSYNETIKLSRSERKAQGLPPNAYFEQQYLLEMNPATGRAEFEKKSSLQEELIQKNRFEKNVPGSDDNAWVERGPSNVPGRTRAMLFDPNDATNNRVFAGGVSGGLWVNNNVNLSASPWTRVGIPENLAVSSITVDPNDSNTFYLGTGESYVAGRVNGNGIWKSTNGGSSWTHIFGGSTGSSFFNGGSQVTVNSPGSISGVLTAIRASFGPAFSSAVTGNLVLVDDGTSSSLEGCNTLTNAAAINGNIAVVERGSCNFTVKVKNAENAGATAVVVINNIAGFPFAMGGTDNTIVIPSLMISNSDGATILAALQTQTVNVTLNDTNTGTGIGLPAVPGIFHINDIITRNNSGTTEIYAAVADATYREGPGGLLGGGEFGLYKSTNAGTSWSKLALPLTAAGNPHAPNDIEISSNNTIWVSTTTSRNFGDGGGTIFSSTDGVTFTQRQVVAGAARTEIEVSTTDANKIYVLADANPITFLKTEDAFATVITTSTGLSLPDDADNGIPATDFTRGQAFYDLMLEADPTNDEIVYVGWIDIFRSTDGGADWTQISRWSNNANLNTLSVPFVHADIHEMSFDPSNPNRAIIATDGGVYYANSLSSANISASAIRSIPRDFNTTQFYWGEIGQNSSNDQFIGGAQDNGSNFINAGLSGINSSSEISGGDGGYCFIDKDGAYLITSFTNNSYNRFSLPNTGSSVTVVDDDDTGSFINPADLDDNLDILYTNGSGATLQISRFENLLTTSPDRTNFTDPLLTATPTVLKVSPFTTASTTLFVGTSGGDVLKVTNANGTPVWSRITGSEFLGSISAINFGTNENEIFVTFHNYGVNNIWYTANGGTTWINKEGDFPDIPVKAIMMNPLLNNEVIIGTDLGVWRTANFSDANPNWLQSQNGMQNVKVTSFDLRTSDNTVLATTYGRGFFTGKFTAAPLSVEEISAKDDRITLFPNPSDGNLKIRTSIDFGASKITVFDMNGRAVYSQNSILSETTDLNVSNLKSGLYILRIQSEQFGYNKKFFIK